MPIFTMQSQRANAHHVEWANRGQSMTIDAVDAIDAAFIAMRHLRVIAKHERLLLWEGRRRSGTPRIFHPGS